MGAGGGWLLVEQLAKDKTVLSDVFDECWPRDTEAGIPYPLKKTPRFPIAAPPYVERICYATFNYRAGCYTAENHIYAKETVMAAFQEYTPSPFLPGNPTATILALALAAAWQQRKLGRYCQAGMCPSSNLMFKAEEEVCEVTPH
eukprot:jgi/Tetstr1/424174/TSEL_014780.t1